MEIKCNINPNYLNSEPTFGSKRKRASYAVAIVDNGADIFVKRPDASASGLLDKKSKFVNSIRAYIRLYKENVKHTYNHKVYYALVEKELFGKNSINAYTHDADKMIMYLLGFPKSFVTKFHRKHSEHHMESSKKMNLKSMLCDLVSSSPEFKPEKKLSLREFYNKSSELKRLKGFKELLEKHNFGENIDVARIKAIKNCKYTGLSGLYRLLRKGLLNFVQVL